MGERYAIKFIGKREWFNEKFEFEIESYRAGSLRHESQGSLLNHLIIRFLFF